MIGAMKGDSKKREHLYETIPVLDNLLDALKRLSSLQDPTDVAVRCFCRPECVVPLHLYGAHPLSPDRTDDALNYGDGDQILNIISAQHNTQIKRTAVPEERTEPIKWVHTTAGAMNTSTKGRMTVLAKKVEKTLEDVALLDRYNKESVEGGVLTYTAYKMLLVKTKSVYSNCGECHTKLYYGDANGMLTQTKVWQQASPDRLTRSAFYEEGSIRMVCQACQFTDHHQDRIDREEEHSGDVVTLTHAHLKEMEKNVTERLEKARAGQGSSKRSRTT